jgi:hypothetical protein
MVTIDTNNLPDYLKRVASIHNKNVLNKFEESLEEKNEKHLDAFRMTKVLSEIRDSINSLSKRIDRLENIIGDGILPD